MDNRLVAFQRLLDIMDELREKCPWDKKQTIDSLRSHTIEETYELADAIIEKNWEGLKGEVGDLLMHMVFYAIIAKEQNKFDIADALTAISDKLVFRHPHIYGDAKVKDEKEVERNWEKLKLKEGNKSVLSGVPKALPAIVKATRIQEKVRGIGFDWENAEQVREKVEEEFQELNEEISNQTDKVEDEFGDVLFSLINYARFIDVNPERALEKTNRKFQRRFQQMEILLKAENKQIDQLNLEQMNSYWEKAKKSVG